MKTIREHLEMADRKRLLDCLSYRFLSDPLHLLELKEHTVQEIKERYSQHMDTFVERLLGLDIKRSDSHVFYLYPVYISGEALDLVELADIVADIEAPGLDFSLEEWRKSLGFLVAETKLTQDNIIQLLAEYLEQASFFGTEEGTKARTVAKIEKQLQDGIESMRDGESKSAEAVFDELRIAHGLPIPEKDSRQNELRGKVVFAIHEYEMYGRARERKRILASWKAD